MNREVISHDLCTGCSACYSSCPISCIRMKYDEDGFIYPEKTNTCIKCGKCANQCPRINQKESTNRLDQQIAFAAKTKNTRVWRRSASGGAFYELCKAWSKNGETMFVGAAWDGFSVKHTCVHELEDTDRFSKSKYIQSEIGDTFLEIKNWLKNGKWVVFSGTPCQVDGLKSYLGSDYDKILYIDLICHGVGSPSVFRNCIKLIESQINERIVSYCFRSKAKFFERDHITKITTERNKSLLLSSDPYLELFVRQTCLRKSCGKNCIYRTPDRKGDITIGDFKGLAKVFPFLSGSKYNYSTIVVNSNKGKIAFDLLDNGIELHKCSVTDVEQYNPLFSRQTYFNEERDIFFEQYRKNPIEAIKQYSNPIVVYKRSLKYRIFLLLPTFLRAKIVGRQ